MKKRVLLTALMFMIFLCGIAVLSAREIDQMPELEPGRKGSLSVAMSYRDENGEKVAIAGVTLQAIRVADLTVMGGGSSTYTLTDNFKESGIIFDGIDASSSNQSAKALKAIVLEKGLSGQACVTDTEGMAYFSDLEPAMYLVLQTANEDSVPPYTEMDPYLVSVPQGIAGTQDAAAFWEYEVDTIPKTEVGRKPATGSIIVTKRVSMSRGDEQFPMAASDSTFYIGLFKDEAGTKPYNEDYRKTVHLVNASSGQVEYTDLPEGVYYVYEMDEDGKIIRNGETSAAFPAYTCTVEENEEQKITLDPAVGTDSGTIIFNNVYNDLPSGYYIEAKLKIRKNVYRGSDRVIVNDTFYAGIFTKENGVYVLNQTVELKQNAAVEVPLMLEGNDAAKPVEYWIFETDRDGNRVDKNSFAYEVSGEGSVKVNRDNLEETAEITNRIRERETVEESEAESSAASRDVKTGDENPVIPYVLFSIASFLVMAVLAGRSLKKHRK